MMTRKPMRVPQGQLPVKELEGVMNPALLERIKRESAGRRDHMSPKGKLGLPPLLDQRRLEYGIVDECFAMDAVYQRLLLWQLPPRDYEKGTHGNSMILMTDRAIGREYKEAPRGIIVSAGTDALDYLISHGMDLGHIVAFCEEAPYGFQVGLINGKAEKLIIVDAGDVCASEDLAAARVFGKCKVVLDAEDNTHKLVDEHGDAWSPMKKTPRTSQGF